jgi:ketosteroid isomerase-like protein
VSEASEVVQRYVKLFEANDADAFNDVLADDCTVHVPDGSERRGREAVKQGLLTPGFRCERCVVDDMVADGERVAVRFT